MIIIGCDFHPSWQQIAWVAQISLQSVKLFRRSYFVPSEGLAGATLINGSANDVSH